MRILALLAPFQPATGSAAEIIVPLRGNAYFTQGVGKKFPDALHLTGPGQVLSVFFHLDRPTDLDLALEARIVSGPASVRVQADSGDRALTADLPSGDAVTVPLGILPVPDPGYVRIDCRLADPSAAAEVACLSLRLRARAPETVVSRVIDNGNNRFYWGRRGPSVHLAYALPPEATLPVEWFYQEVSVPEGQDPVGSFFMANGFGEGYFGMQVNGPAERRILFSVWSPFPTDDPSAIPEDQRIRLLAKGEDVRTGEFGHEGSGGQSFLVFPWRTGATYRFLNRARPDGHGSTIYTAWFRSPDDPGWRLIASFLRPRTDKHLTGLHSFLENFQDDQGWLTREGRYGPAWACDTGGTWHPLTSARLTGDDMARRGERLDFTGGTEGAVWFLRNGGFFHRPVPLGSVLVRDSGPAAAPDLGTNWDHLPGR
jgi:hypothetical protein